MTPKQSEVLKFIENFWKKKGYSPSYDEVCAGTGLKSRSSVHRIVHALAKRNIIHIGESQHRMLVPPGFHDKYMKLVEEERARYEREKAEKEAPPD